MARAPSFDRYRTVSDVHQELIKLLSCDYLVEGNDGARTFIIRSRKYLKTPKDKQEEKVEDVLEALRAKGMFTEGNYKVLKELTREIDDDIDQLITEAEEKIENIKNKTTSSTEKKEIDRELQVRIDVQSDMQKKGKAVVLAVFQWTIQNSNKSHIPKLLHCSEFETIITDLYIICCESYTKDHLSDYGRNIFSSCIEAAEKSFKAGEKQFLQFKKDQLPELKRFIKTSGENWRKTFSAFDAEASSVLCRCVYLYLKFDSVIGLERFWHYYTSCQFVKDLNNCFNSSIVLNLLNVDRLDLTACISDIEYRNLHEYLRPRAISPNIRASADSRIPSDEKKRKRNFTDQMIPPGPEESIEEKISGMPDEKDQEHYIETRDYLGRFTRQYVDISTRVDGSFRIIEAPSSRGHW